jgi:hypothetical protein
MIAQTVLNGPLLQLRVGWEIEEKKVIVAWRFKPCASLSTARAAPPDYTYNDDGQRGHL